MGLVTATLLLLMQEKREHDPVYEESKVIVERNVFAPFKPEKKREEPRKREEKKPEEKKEPPPPYVTGFESYPDGFRILVFDPLKNSSARHAVGEKLAGGTIVSIDNTKAVIQLANGTKELRTGDPVTDAASTVRKPSPAEIAGRSQGQQGVQPADDTRDKMKERNRRRWNDGGEEDDTPRRRRRGDGGR